MFGDMMDKLQNMKQQVEEIKVKLDGMTVVGEAAEGKVKVTVTGNRTVRNVFIDPSLMSDAEELEDYITIASNRALTQANALYEQEMAGAAGGLMGM